MTDNQTYVYLVTVSGSDAILKAFLSKERAKEYKESLIGKTRFKDNCDLWIDKVVLEKEPSQ